MKNILMALLLPLFIVSCAGPSNMAYEPTITKLSIPELDTERKASIGESLVSYSKIQQYDALRIERSSDYSVCLYEIRIPAQMAYAHEYDKNTGNLEYGATILLNNIATDGFVSFPNMPLMSISPEPDGTYSFKHQCGSRQILNSPVYKTKADKRDSYSFTQELIYNGRVDDDVKFVYREYSNQMARSAFSQQAQYDLNVSNIIAFKSAKLKIIEATNEFVVYEVLSHFDEIQ